MQPRVRRRQRTSTRPAAGRRPGNAPHRRGHYAARVITLRRRHRQLAGLVLTLLATAAPPAAAQSPGTDRVRLPFPAYDGTLTPYTFAIGYPLVTLVYDTLLWRDADGVPQPWLARSVTRSDGGRRLTVRLRDGVRWHDGRALTAADVAFTFGHVASRYQPRFTPQVENVRRVSATGRLTAVIELRTPSLGFDDQPLADLPILPRHRWQGLPPGRAAPAGPAIGSGPYRLVSASRERGYVLRANSRYFLGAPSVREIGVPIIGDAERTYAALSERRVDMIPLNLPERAARDLGDTLGVRVQRGASYVGTMVALNTSRAPFNRRRARQAFASALDVDRIARGVAPAVAADEGFIHPASRWSGDLLPEGFNPDEARAGRSALGARVIRVLAPSHDPVRLEAGRQVVRALTQIGAPATLVRRTRVQLERAVGTGGPAARFDAVIQSIPALASHDPNGLTRMFGSDPRLAPLNITGYRSAAFDAAAAQVASATDAAGRRRAVRTLLDQLVLDRPAVPLFFSQGNFAYRPSIYSGWTYIKGSGILDKRSFLVTADATEGPAAEEPPLRSAQEDSGLGFSLLNIISLALLGIVIVVAAAAVVQRRRQR